MQHVSISVGMYQCVRGFVSSPAAVAFGPQYIVQALMKYRCKHIYRYDYEYLIFPRCYLVQAAHCSRSRDQQICPGLLQRLHYLASQKKHKNTQTGLALHIFSMRTYVHTQHTYLTSATLGGGRRPRRARSTSWHARPASA